jgi:hypothetical protein
VMLLLLMKAFYVLHALWSIIILFASSSGACKPVASLGKI